FALSPDGNILAVADPQEGFWVWHLSENRQMAKFTADWGEAGAFAIDAAGTRLALTDREAARCLYATDGTLLARWRAPAPLGPLAFLPADRLLAATPAGPILLCALEPAVTT